MGDYFDEDDMLAEQEEMDAELAAEEEAARLAVAQVSGVGCGVLWCGVVWPGSLSVDASFAPRLT
jgi:hypothetical protein